MCASRGISLEPVLRATLDVGAPVAPNERIYAQITTRGHGWEQTDEKCGEFCKVTYKAKFDGAEFSYAGPKL